MGKVRPYNEVWAIELLIGLIVFIALCLSSCKCPQIAESVNVRDSIVYHDSVITVHDTSIFSTFAYVDSILNLLNNRSDTTIIKTTKRGVTTTLRVANGKLICEATIDSLQAKINSIQSHVRIIERTRIVWKEKELTWWQKALVGFGGASMIFILFGLFWKVGK